MVTLLINLFIREKEDVKSPKVRQQYGMLCGMVGIMAFELVKSSVEKILHPEYLKSPVGAAAGRRDCP